MSSYITPPDPSEKVQITFDPAVPAEISDEVFDNLQRIWGPLTPLDRDLIEINRKTLDVLLLNDERIVAIESPHSIGPIRISVKSSAQKSSTVLPAVKDSAENIDDVSEDRYWTTGKDWENAPVNESLQNAQAVVDRIRKEKRWRSFRFTKRSDGYHYLYRGKYLPVRNEDQELRSYEEVLKWGADVKFEDDQRFCQ